MKAKDGWHKIAGCDVFVESNKVLRGTIGSGTSYRTGYPYKYIPGSGMVNVSGVSVDAFRYGVKRGNIELL